MSLKLKPFQRAAVKALESSKYDTIVLSTPRAQGKSSLAAELCFRALTPGDSLYVRGSESHLVAGTIGQSRKTCFKILRRLVEASPRVAEYKISESANSCHIRHRLTNTRVSVVAGSAKSTLGLVGCPLVVVDEPGAYELEGGAALWDSLLTALGKPESPLRIFVIGHLSPRATGPGHWFFDLVAAGTRGRTWVLSIAADRAKWDKASEIRRCSPLSWGFPESRAKLLEQRDEARSDLRLKAAFLSFRLNVPSGDESSVLLTIADWEAIEGRPVPPRRGNPVIGVDLAAGRAWSAAVSVWVNGRTEAVALAPGLPDIRSQEIRDKVIPGTYQKLVDQGLLDVADGLNVQTPGLLMDRVFQEWGDVRFVIADRFRVREIRDHVPSGVRVIPRTTRWSESSEDIRALRKGVRDGPLTVAQESRPIMEASLAVAMVANDDAGSVRLIKRGANNQSRDDVCAAWLIAAGARARLRPARKTKAVLCA